jgi:TDG/mug DNA glycosylase family protein
VIGVPEILCDRPAILFVGINPGMRSGETGHNFAGKNNPFWRLLYEARLTPRLLAPEEDARLADFGYALTNLCPRTTRAANELTASEIAAGRTALLETIARIRPRVVALVGLTLYQQIFGHARSGGPGGKPERPSGAKLFVVPNPSGLNASFPGFEDKLIWFERLREYAGISAPPPEPTPPTAPRGRPRARAKGRTRARR